MEFWFSANYISDILLLLQTYTPSLKLPWKTSRLNFVPVYDSTEDKPVNARISSFLFLFYCRHFLPYRLSSCEILFMYLDDQTFFCIHIPLLALVESVCVCLCVCVCCSIFTTVESVTALHKMVHLRTACKEIWEYESGCCVTHMTSDCFERETGSNRDPRRWGESKTIPKPYLT